MAGEDTLYMNFFMAGGAVTGTFSWGGYTGGTLKVVPQNGTAKTYVTRSDKDSFVVSEYGEVGKKVKGTFNGTFFYPATSVDIIISNATFEVNRTADQ